MSSPDDPISATTDRHDRRAVLGRDLKLVPEDVVLIEPAPVSRDSRESGELHVRVVLCCVGHRSYNVLLLSRSLSLSHHHREYYTTS